MWLPVALVITLVICTTGCKRAPRSSDTAVDTATCVSVQQFKERSAQVYRCELMMARDGFKDRTRIQACMKLGCTLEPPVGKAPGNLALSSTLFLASLISTTMGSYGTMTTATAMMVMAVLPSTAMEVEKLGTTKDDTKEEEWRNEIQEVNASLAFNLKQLEQTEKQIASLNETLQLWTQRLNETLYLDRLLMEKVEQLEVETGSGIDDAIMDNMDNATMDDAIMDNATIDAEDTTMTPWSDNERPGQENDILEKKIISYLVLVSGAVSCCIATGAGIWCCFLLYKSREA